MVVERKRVDRLGIQTSTRKRVPLPSYRNGKGEVQVAHKSHTQGVFIPDTLYTRSVKTDWQCRPAGP